MKKPFQKVILLLLAAALFSSSLHASTLVNDPFAAPAACEKLQSTLAKYQNNGWVVSRTDWAIVDYYMQPEGDYLYAVVLYTLTREANSNTTPISITAFVTAYQKAGGYAVSSVTVSGGPSGPSSGAVDGVN